MSDGKLLEKASKLTAEVNWVTEYHDRWSRIGGFCKAQVNMCRENKTPDTEAIQILESVIQLSAIKVEKCAEYLRKKTPELHALMTEVNYGD